MKTLSPIETIQSLYAAFERGDIPAILAQLRSDVDWHTNVDQAAPGVARVPTFRPSHGPAGVGEFFATLNRSCEFHAFTPRSFLSGDRQIAVHVEMEFTVRSTGRRLKMEAIHLWTLDEDDRVRRFVDFLDTLGEAAAWDAIAAKS